MSSSIKCTTCGARLQVKAEVARKRGRCPRCHGVVEESPQCAARQQNDGESAPSASRPIQQLDLRSILQAFQGNIPPVRRTAGYRLGILLIAITVVALPVLYLGLIAAVAYLLYLHAANNLGLVSMPPNWKAVLFLYVGPLVIGAILLFFMIKPFFARRARAKKLRTLEFGAEPLFCSVVTKIAQTLGAPEPKRIEVDCQVNASASFGGVLRLLFGGDLVLTIGLPLVAGLSIQQLAGVIAHELGHFSQGVGMRLSYIVRAINAWFATIVYERDDLDESLRNAMDEGGRFALVPLMAMFSIWLTRRILWVFMMVSHALSCFLMRRQEYDADRYEARLAGAKAFAETFQKVYLLDAATSGAFVLAAHSWHATGRLPDDLCTLTNKLSESISRREVRKLEKLFAKEKTGLFDTHPSYAQRLVSVERENAPGVFHLAGPATQLFKDFTKLSRSVTLDFYREVFGKRVKRDALVPVASLVPDPAAAKSK